MDEVDEDDIEHEIEMENMEQQMIKSQIVAYLSEWIQKYSMLISGHVRIELQQ